MAGVGDEIGPHLLDAPQRREIVEGHQHQIGPVQFRLTLHRLHDHFKPAIERHALGILDALLFSAGIGAADRLDQFGHAQRKRHRFALAQGRRQRTRPVIERQHSPIPIERDDRIRQAGDDGLEPLARALGDGDRPHQPARLLGGAVGEQGDRCKDSKTEDGVSGR